MNWSNFIATEPEMGSRPRGTGQLPSKEVLIEAKKAEIFGLHHEHIGIL